MLLRCPCAPRPGYDKTGEGANQGRAILFISQRPSSSFYFLIPSFHHFTISPLHHLLSSNCPSTIPFSFTLTFTFQLPAPRSSSLLYRHTAVVNLSPRPRLTHICKPQMFGVDRHAAAQLYLNCCSYALLHALRLKRHRVLGISGVLRLKSRSRRC